MTRQTPANYGIASQLVTMPDPGIQRVDGWVHSTAAQRDPRCTADCGNADWSAIIYTASFITMHALLYKECC